MNLPPLPEPSGVTYFVDAGYVPNYHYTEQQMREYGELCRKMALEEAIKACTNEREVVLNRRNPDYVSGYNKCYGVCSEAIQGLI